MIMIYKCICGKEFDSQNALNAHKANCLISKEKHLKDLTLKVELEKNYEFICVCGRRFEKRTSLNSHARFCDKYIKKEKCSEYYNPETNIYKCECGKEFEKSQSINGHFSHCFVHRENLGKDNSDIYWNKRKQKYQHTGMNWNKLTKEEIAEIHKKSGKTLSKNIQEGKTKPCWLGKKHSDEDKAKIRQSTINYIKQQKGSCVCRYSKIACQYIDKLNKEKSWNLQHAENGGEICIDGYFIDGYDKERNIVFEYDEKRHYIDVENNILREKDVKRQNYLIEKLKCEFYRYNEAKDYFYKVN